MQGEKSSRNRTLHLSEDEVEMYFSRCINFNQNPQNNSQSFTKESLEDKTICGDTFAVLKSLPENLADLAIVDPPYNLSKDYAGKVFKETSNENYLEYTRQWLSLLLPKIKESGSLYICCDWKSSMLISQVLLELEAEKKLFIQNRITWQREKGRGAKSNWKNGMEDIWFCSISKDYIFNLDAVKMRRRVIAPYKTDGQPKDWKESESGNFRDTCPSNFWDDISIPFWSMAENTDHPTQKPEKLIAKLILASSNKGDLVLDPFLGSGTTSVVAKKLERHFVGIEQNKEYCSLAERRLFDAENDREIQGYTDGVFWERNTLKEQKNFAHRKKSC